MILNLLILILGVFFCSTAVVMIKISQLDAIFLAAMRQLAAGLILLPLFIRDFRKTPVSFSQIRLTFLPGVILGLHFIAWIIGARMTPAANSSLIVNLVPVAMPFLLYFLMKEKLTPVEMWATLLSLAGMLLLTGADFNLSRHFFWGDVICFVSMIFFAVYLALARHNRHFPGIWLYLVPLYWTGGLFCFAVYWAANRSLPHITAGEWGLIAALAVLPTVLGHSSLNYAMKKMRGQVVSLINMAQFVFAGILAYFIFDEIPMLLFYPASLMLLLGAAVSIWKHPQT